MYRACIKDGRSINSLPKAYLRVFAFDLNRDLLASKKTTFDVDDVPESVVEGDLIILYTDNHSKVYTGVVSMIEEKRITATQMQSFYKGTWIMDNYPGDYLEEEIQYLVNRFANGYQKGSSYQDTLIESEKSPIRVLIGSLTGGKLPAYKEQATTDMEKWIYSLYQDYGIIFDFNVPYGSWEAGDPDEGKCRIFRPNYSKLVVGDNVSSLRNISPVTEVEETNKLIIYNSEGEYVTTYYATSNGIVEEPTTDSGRFNIVNTKVIYSDDEKEVIRDANLKTSMYNHQLSFVMRLKNNLWDFFTWRLGQPIEVHYKDHVYNSVFTGYSLKKEENREPTEVEIICGNVRTSLTSKLLMNIVK